MKCIKRYDKLLTYNENIFARCNWNKNETFYCKGITEINIK